MTFEHPTIAQLQQELRDKIETVSVFRKKSYSIFSLDDFSDVTQLKDLPVVGIVYTGGGIVTNNAVPVAKGAHGATLFVMRFSVILAIEYKATGDEQAQATGARRGDL